MPLMKFRFGQRLAIGYGLIMALMVAVTVVGMNKLRVLSETTNDVLHDKYPKTTLVTTVNNNLNIIARDMRNVLILNQPEQVSLQLAEIIRAREKMNEALEKLGKMVNNPNGKRLVGEINVVHAQYIINQEQFVVLMQQERFDEARTLLLVDLHRFQNDYFQLLENLRADQEGLMELAKRDFASSYLTARNLMFVLTSLAILLSLGITYLIARSLLRQLGGEPEYAALVARKIAGGDLFPKIELDVKDRKSLLYVMSIMRDSLVERTHALEESNADLASTVEALGAAHAAQAESAETLRQLGEIGKELTANLDQEAIFETLHQHLARLLAFDGFGVALQNTEADALDLIYYTRHDLLICKTTIPFTHPASLLVQVLREGKEVRLQAADIDSERLYPVPLLASVVLRPLVANGRQIGVVLAQSQLPDFFQARELEILRSASAFAAIALANASAYHMAELARQQAAQAQQTAEMANQMKSEFLAMISHEVRTPLGGVIGMLRFALKDTGLTAATLHKLTVGLSNAEALLQIINDILDFSKLEAGKMSIESIDFELPSLVRDIETTLIERAESKGLSLVLEISPDLAPWWRGDPARLRQVLINLIGNAIKFTETGEVRLKIWLENTRLTFAVSDTGIGIADEAKARLFQKFEQADSSTARRFGGTGLGLAICKQIVDAMGGKIDVHSVPEQGSTFTFCLPLAPGAPVVQRVVAPVRLRHPVQLRILCAEDSATNQIIVRELLRGMGHVAEIVEDGFATLEALARREYDLLLLDSRMPRMDGLETLRRLRRGEHAVRDAQIPVIALTANVGSVERERFLAAGADGFLGKPLDEGLLHDEIGRIIKRLQEAGQPISIRDLDTTATPIVPTAGALAAGGAATGAPAAGTPAAGTPAAGTPAAGAPAAPIPSGIPGLPSFVGTAVIVPGLGASVARKCYAPQMQGFGNAAREALLQAFFADVPQQLAIIHQSFAAADAEGLAVAAHSLKGSSSYFDIKPLTDMCIELEAAADNGDFAAISGKLARFDALVEASIWQLKHYCA